MYSVVDLIRKIWRLGPITTEKLAGYLAYVIPLLLTKTCPTFCCLPYPNLLGGNMTSHRTTMHLRSASLTNMNPSKIHIIRQITCSDSSAIFEVDLDGQKYALMLFHDNGDPGYIEKVVI